MTGNNVSHANNKTKRVFNANIHTHRYWLEDEKRFIKLTLSAKGMRMIDKIGLPKALEIIRARGEKI